MGRTGALEGTSADSPGAGCDAHQPHLLLPVIQEVCNPLTGGGGHSELGVEDVWNDTGLIVILEKHKLHKKSRHLCLVDYFYQSINNTSWQQILYHWKTLES